ncbi:MAG TPA: zinc-binding dehydrogenase [Candidatus Hydrogenedentes bacterium]|nr:zinc-binding dehydrogenase [Candidatus Hydrogenedentota bacterium]
MRAWRFHEPGDIRNLVLEEVPDPEVGPDESLVRVETAALNPADRYLVQGQYPRAGKPPFTPGRDGAGVVVKPGNSGRFKEGDRVCVLGGLTGISSPGLLAEYCAVPDAWLAPVPDGWTMEEAAAGPLTLLTAWRALRVRGELRSGETVLVTGASGGVGSAAVMLASGLGARVLALSRDPAKRNTLVSLGAAVALDAAAPDIEKQVKSVAPEGISLVVENLGGLWLDRCLRMVAPHGRVMVVGLLAGLTAEVTIGLLIHKNLRVEGLSVSAYAPEEAGHAWREITDLLAKTGRKPVIDRVFDFESVQAAFDRLADGPLGKVVIRVGIASVQIE